MSVATRLGRAARGDLARLIAVVMLLGGLALAHGMQCGGTMGATGPAVHTCTGAEDDDVRVATGMAHARSQAGLCTSSSGHPDAAKSSVSGTVVVAMVGVQEAPIPGGLLGTCLALVIGVVTTVVFASLRPTLLRLCAPAPNRRRLAPLGVAHLRASSLAELCLLRR